MRLNLGCGTDKREGYVNVDAVAAFHADLNWDLHNPLPYKSGGVEEILAQDVLEHFNRQDADTILRHWVDLLGPGGQMRIRVPDWGRMPKTLDNIFGAIDWKGVDTGDFGVHKWAYTEQSLRFLMEHCGLSEVAVQPVAGQLYAVGVKPK